MPQKKERRSAPRISINQQASFLYRQGRNRNGRIKDISETGATILSDVTPVVDEIILLYPKRFGRLPGKVARVFHGGFAISFILSKQRRKLLSERLDLIEKGLPFVRVPAEKESPESEHDFSAVATMSGESEAFSCMITELSPVGCQILSDRRPAIGTYLSVNALEGVVTEHIYGGFAVKYLTSDHPS